MAICVCVVVGCVWDRFTVGWTQNLLLVLLLIIWSWYSLVQGSFIEKLGGQYVIPGIEQVNCEQGKYLSHNIICEP